MTQNILEMATKVKGRVHLIRPLEKPTSFVILSVSNIGSLEKGLFSSWRGNVPGCEEQDQSESSQSV